MSLRQESGAASVEYVLVTFVVVTVLFIEPVEGVSLVEYVLEALRKFQRHSTYLLSMP